MKKIKLKQIIREVIQDLEEHPQSWSHTHVSATCWGCENTIPYSHTTDWVLNPAPGGINYCQEPIDPTPIQSNWWADDQQWIIDNICAYQTPASACSQIDFDITGTAATNADMVNAWAASAGPHNFLVNMYNGYVNNGCQFLQNVLAKHQGHLSTGLGGPQGDQPMGTNWTPQKQSKADFLIEILATCQCN